MRRSQVFLYFCLAFIVGVLFGSLVEIPLIWLYGFAWLGFVSAVLFWSWPGARFLFLSAVFLFLGFWRITLALSKDDKQTDISFYNGQNVIFTAQVISEPKLRSRLLEYLVKVINLSKAGRQQPIEGRVLLRTDKFSPPYQIGQFLQITCRLAAPTRLAEFDYPAFLAKDDIYSICSQPSEIKQKESETVWWQAGWFGFRRWVVDFKANFKEVINRSLPWPESSLVTALTLGVREELPLNLQESFRRTGTAHLMAVSGLHLMIVSGFLLEFLMILGISKKRAFLLTTLALFFFIVLVGFKPSAIRAGIMSWLIALALIVSRPKRLVNILLLAACVMLLFKPKLLRWDLGFQLSFLAVSGLIFLGPILRQLFHKLPNKLQLREILVMTLAAQFFTYPWVIYNFRQFSLVAPLVNLLILPFLPLVLGGGFLIGLLGLVWLEAAKVLGWPFGLILRSIIFIVEKASQFSLSAWEIKKFPFWLTVILYSLIFCLGYWLNKRNLSQQKIQFERDKRRQLLLSQEVEDEKMYLKD